MSWDTFYVGYFEKPMQVYFCCLCFIDLGWEFTKAVF